MLFLLNAIYLLTGIAIQTANRALQSATLSAGGTQRLPRDKKVSQIPLTRNLNTKRKAEAEAEGVEVTLGGVGIKKAATAGMIQAGGSNNCTKSLRT